MPALDEPLIDSELDELDGLLLSLAERLDTKQGEEIDSIVCLSEFDGFCAALVGGPAIVPSSEWFPALWDGHAPPVDSEAESKHIFELLVRHMNDVSAALQLAPEDFRPMFDETIGDDEPQLIVEEWCNGYLRGVELRADLWQPLVEDVPDALDLLVLFATPEGWEELEKLDDAQVEQLRSEIPDAVRDIYAYWLQRRTIRRETPKVGRNDPCPCGSGRKHKQCCLQ